MNSPLGPHVKLCEVARVQSGAGFPDKFQGGRNLQFPLYKVSDMNLAGNETEMISETNSISEETRQKLGAVVFPHGSVIFPKVGGAIATNKKRLIVKPACVDNNVMGVIPIPTKINSRLLFYFFQAHDLSEFANDAGLPSITKTTVENWVLGTVPPLIEQQRTVGILDEAFDGIATAKANAAKNLQNARALFDTHLEFAFGVGGAEWKERSLQSVLRTQPRNGWSPPAANHSDSGTPVLTLSSVTGFQFRPEKIKYTSIPTDARRHYWVSNDDLLISRSNTPQLVGHVAIASDINIPTIYPDLIMRMNPDPAQALTRFLWYQLRTQKLRDEIMGRAQGANPTMKKIDKEAVQTLPIRIPSLENQKQVVAQLDSIATETKCLSTIYQRKLGALDSLKKSLLYKAFSGKL